MSVKRIIASKPVLLSLLGLLLLVGLGLGYYELFGEGPQALKILLPIVYIGAVALVLRTGGVIFPAEYQRGILSGHVGIGDLAKCAICFVASLLWVAIAARLISNTPAGFAILLIPFFLLLGASAVFFARSIYRRAS